MKEHIVVNGTVTVRNNKFHAVLYWKENDVRKQKWVSLNLPIRGNKKKAVEIKNQLVKELEEELNSRNTINPCDMTFGDFLKYWLETEKPNLQKSTYIDYYNRIYNILAPYFGEKKLVDINEFDIQNFYNYRINKGNKGMTVKRYHANILKALSYAKKTRLISENPAEFVDLPKTTKYIAKYYTADELKILLKAVKGMPLETPVILAVYYGLRRSEIIGLRWDAVDFENKTIAIRTKATQAKGVSDNKQSIIIFEEEMKTQSSIRVLPLIRQVEEHFIELKKHIAVNQAFYGNSYNSQYKDYICVHENGNIIYPEYCTQRFKKLIKTLPITQDVTFHGLRHSCATMLLTLGFSIKEIQTWLGHSSFQVTADIYSHVSLGAKRIMGDRMETAFEK